ncbi:MAG: carboxypeptidase-like regulatory domain-containing protein [Holophaga sp.]|nr:carboxypeptidase-like regulatory domain-containing protein [Holophaga sp.]
MITGYNSDVRHGSRIFHVQTEDKGLGNPKIETLIYLGGEILDSYRGTYEDLLAEPQQDQIIQARMDEQHKSVIRDIKNGKYDTTPNDPQVAEQHVFNDRPLDQAILEYLAHDGDLDTLELVLDQPIRPVFGRPFSFSIRARLCASQNPVAGADVAVRLISSFKKAGILAGGKTDADGSFSAQVDLPPSQPGHCAVVISCSSDFGNDELRALITD